MSSALLKQLQKEKQKVARLEARVAYERTLQLSGLPAEFGFDSAAEFIAAVREACRTVPGRSRKGKMISGRKRKRAKITAQIKAKVISAVKAGKTGAAIAKACGISLPSVQNIKKAAGLVRKR